MSGEGCAPSRCTPGAPRRSEEVQGLDLWAGVLWGGRGGRTSGPGCCGEGWVGVSRGFTWPGGF